MFDRVLDATDIQQSAAKSVVGVAVARIEPDRLAKGGDRQRRPAGLEQPRAALPMPLGRFFAVTRQGIAEPRSAWQIGGNSLKLLRRLAQPAELGQRTQARSVIGHACSLPDNGAAAANSGDSAASRPIARVRSSPLGAKAAGADRLTLPRGHARRRPKTAKAPSPAASSTSEPGSGTSFGGKNEHAGVPGMQLKPGVWVSAEDTKLFATMVPKMSCELVSRAPGARIDVSQKPLPIATFVASKKLNSTFAMAAAVPKVHAPEQLKLPMTFTMPVSPDGKPENVRLCPAA